MKTATKEKPAKTSSAEKPVDVAAEAPSPEDEKRQQQDSIAQASREVERDAGKLKTINEMVAQAVEKLPSFDKVADLEGQLAAARERLKTEKIGSKEINDLLDNAAEARTDVKNSRAVLSMLLVAWLAKYSQKSVVVDSFMHEIDVTAKIGKELDRQEALPL